MGVLNNARHEAFVQNLIRGMTQRQAYLDVYESAKKWKPESVDNKAYALFKRGEVQARYKELQEATAKEAVASLQEIQEYFTRVIRGEVKDYAVSSEGAVAIPARLGERNKAATELGKMLGGYETNVNLNADVGLEVVVDYGDD